MHWVVCQNRRAPEPDRRYAIYSTVVDGFIVENQTKDQIIAYYRRDALRAIDKRTAKLLAEADAGAVPHTYAELRAIVDAQRVVGV